MSADIEPILGTARELYGRVVWSHKVHEQDREIWSEKVCTMSRINIWLAGLTTFLAVISVKFPESYAIIATALLATTTVCFVIWQASSDPATKESKHRVVAKELLWCREQLLLLITACHTATPIDQLQSRLELLTREVTAVYKFAPDTSPEAYARADKMLKSGHFTFSSDEIDAMLPTALRKNQKEG
jgi:SMODS and SLOG-associating 2TM effector domain family 4